MYKTKLLLANTIIILTLLILSIPHLAAQSDKNNPVEKPSYESENQDFIIYKNGRYHKTKGWVNSIGFHVGNVPDVFNFSAVGETPSGSVDYTVYKLIRPNFAFGGGLAHIWLPTERINYETHDTYNFLALHLYGKLYLDESPRRFYIHTKIGYGIVYNDELPYGCGLCSPSIALASSYKSGITFQPGWGIEFASAKKLRWGISFNMIVNQSTISRELYPDYGLIPEGGLVTSVEDRTLVSGVFGINLFL